MEIRISYTVNRTLRYREASGLRDKVYGFAGLPLGRTDFIDCTASVHTCYEMFAVMIINRNRNLDIFSHLATPEPSTTMTLSRIGQTVLTTVRLAAVPS
jgi:hypothetical protein